VFTAGVLDYERETPLDERGLGLDPHVEGRSGGGEKRRLRENSEAGLLDFGELREDRVEGLRCVEHGQLIQLLLGPNPKHAEAWENTGVRTRTRRIALDVRGPSHATAPAFV
jgi:hypothetical protein